MAQHTQDVPVHPEEHPEAHEQTDISIRAIAWVFAIMVISAVIIHAGLYFLFWGYDRHQASLDVQVSAATPATVPVERPRLQGVPGFNDNTPSMDMAEMQIQVENRMRSQGKLPDGRLHIPIDRAIELVVDRGMLKSVPAATQPAGGQQQQQQQAAPAATRPAAAAAAAGGH